MTRAALSLLAALAIAALGIFLGTRLAGPAEAETPLGRVSLDAVPSFSGAIDAYVPIADWGVRAESFDAPIELRAEVRSIDRSGAIAVAGGSGDALDDAVAELRDAARAEVLRSAAFGLAGVVIVALVAWGVWRRRREPLLGIAVGVVVLAGGVGATAVSFDEESFSTPAFYGRGEELAQLVDFFERQRGNDRYTSTFDGALTNFSAYLSGSEQPDAGPGRNIVFGSDLHNNALVLPSLARFAADKPVLLAGDFGLNGSEAEARSLAPRLAALGDDVYAVSGNHDSAGLMATLARNGVTVLSSDGVLDASGEPTGEQIVDIEGLRVAGLSDPLEWQGADPEAPERVFSFPELPDGEEREAEAEDAVVEWFTSLPERPDVALVHQSGLAAHLASELQAAGEADEPLTIVTGHNHLQSVDRYGEVVVANAGTLGAGGFLRLGQEQVGLGQLHLPTTSAAPTWVDLIRIEPLSGQAEAERAVLDIVCPAEESADGPCEFEPGV